MGKGKKPAAAAKVADAAAESQTAPATVETEAPASTSAAAAPEAPAAKVAAKEYDYVVSTAFRDRNDVEKKVKEPRMYAVGTTVNQFGAERLEDLVKRGLVERRAKA